VTIVLYLVLMCWAGIRCSGWRTWNV